MPESRLDPWQEGRTTALALEQSSSASGAEPLPPRGSEWK